MDHREYFEALRGNFNRAVPHIAECGIRVDALDAEGALACLPYRDDWLGDPARGLIHTGAVSTLVDTVSGLVALAATGDFRPIATLDLRMDYLRPARTGKDLYSRASCYRLSRSIAFVKATVWQEDEAELVAVSQSTFARGSGRPVRKP